MTATIIDGAKFSKVIRRECAERVRRLQTERNVTPSLAVIIVGNDPASRIYVRNKVRAAEEVGVISHVRRQR